MPNIALVPKRGMSSFRTMALGTWRTAKDPSVYGSLELPMDEALRYLHAYREATGRRLTVSHMMARAVAVCLDAIPDANAILRFHRIYLRQDVSVFFQVMMKDPDTGEIDLSGLTIRNADKKDLPTILDEFERVANRVRTGKDSEKEKTRRTFRTMPGWLVGPVLDFIGFLTYTLNLDLSRFGIPKDVFGSVMVTNIGSLGLEEAYVPLVAYSRVPLLLALGRVKKVPLVDDDDNVRVGRVMKVFATFDHRLLDGAHAAKMARILQEWFGDPWTHFGEIPSAQESSDQQVEGAR